MSSADICSFRLVLNITLFSAVSVHGFLCETCKSGVHLNCHITKYYQLLNQTWELTSLVSQSLRTQIRLDMCMSDSNCMLCFVDVHQVIYFATNLSRVMISIYHYKLSNIGQAQVQ